MINIFSLLFIAIAIAIPFMALLIKSLHIGYLSFISMSAVAATLCLQLYELKMRADLEDWSGIADTIETVAKGSFGLVVITFFINTFVLYIVKRAK